MNKLEIMQKILDLQWQMENYYQTQDEIKQDLDEIYFELENMEEN